MGLNYLQGVLKVCISILFSVNTSLYSILQMLVAGWASAKSTPVPQLIIAKVGAHSLVQPDNPENISGSIQDAKFLVLSKAVGLFPYRFSTHAINSFSHSWKERCIFRDTIQSTQNDDWSN